MNNQAIGVFDSGLGGLTAVKELMRELPNENIIYFGDTGRVPYGTRSRETIIKYSMQDVSFLKAHDVKMIIAACGTVSSVATELGDEINVPFTGVVEPTSLAAVNATKNGNVGVIGTTATVKSESYKKRILGINKDVRVFQKDCPLFVPLIENGFISADDKILNLTIEKYLSDLMKYDIDTLILGCTHYPIISSAISNIIGSQINIINSGRETALYASKFLKEKGILSDSTKSGKCSFYVSDSVEGFSNVAKLFLNSDIEHSVSRVNIELY